MVSCQYSCTVIFPNLLFLFIYMFFESLNPLKQSTFVHTYNRSQDHVHTIHVFKVLFFYNEAFVNLHSLNQHGFLSVLLVLFLIELVLHICLPSFLD